LVPLLWAYVAFSEVRAYHSSYSLAINLSITSCFYSIIAIIFQVVTRQKAYSNKKLSQEDAFAADADNMNFLASKMLTY
jgi:hypothetical protein